MIVCNHLPCSTSVCSPLRDVGPGGCEIVSSLIFTLLNWGISQAYILHRDVKTLQITSLRWSSELTRVIGGSESFKLAWKTWDFHAATASTFKLRIWPGDLKWCPINLHRRIRGWSGAMRIIIRVWGFGMFWTSVSQRQKDPSEESVIRVLKHEKSRIPSQKLLSFTQIWATLRSICPPLTFLVQEGN